MKKIIFAFSLVVSIAFLSSCEEIPPYINFEPEAVVEDTTYVSSEIPTPQPRQIVIEEITGVRCPNCPAAQAEAKAISNKYPGRVNITTIHPLNRVSALTTPFDPARGDKHKSKYDFRTQAGAALFDLVGISSSLPVGNVNRIKFPGEISGNIEYQKWSAYSDAELAKSTPLNLEVSAKNIGEDVEIRVKVTYTQAVSDSNYLSVAILESDIEDVQESRDINGASIYVEDYIHNHVLRAMASSFFGDLLKAAYTPGRVFIKTYRYKRAAGWNPANLDVLVFVNKDVTKKEIIHSAEAKVQ
jgi:hypothetical protein